MRILVVSEDIPYSNMGGLAKHALTLSRLLVRAGHTVDVLGGDQHPIDVAGDEGKFGGSFFGELNGHHAGWKEGKLGMFLPPRRTWLARHFARIILRHAHRYDVIHYHGHVPNVARYIPADINFIQTRHDQGSDCLINIRFRKDGICTSLDPAECAFCRTPHPNAFQRAVSTAAVIRFRQEVADGFRRHKTVFVSDMLKRNCARTVSSASRGATVHHFIDSESLQRARAASAPMPTDDIHVFVAAKIYPAKGVEAFLREIAPRLPSNMRVTIAGDGPDEARLNAQFGGSQIRFLGWCTPEKTLQMAASAHAIVIPSLCEESFGSTTLEGLLLGKPTFALARGATPELAAYAASPAQFRLHRDMASLVQDLVSFDAHIGFNAVPDEISGAKRAVQHLLHIYRLPPGHSFD